MRELIRDVADGATFSSAQLQPIRPERDRDGEDRTDDCDK